MKRAGLEPGAPVADTMGEFPKLGGPRSAGLRKFCEEAYFSPMVNRSSAILHVENDPDDIFITQRAFKKVGVSNPAPSVENGEQAVSYLLGKGKFENRKDYPLPSVILLDWNMPLMSGSDFLQWLRSQVGALRRLPVVVLTSSNNDADMRQAYELGANGYLVKPGTHDGFQDMARVFAEYWLGWNRSDVSPAGDLI